MGEIYTSEKLNSMSDIEQADFFTSFLHGDDRANNICFPYVVEKNGKQIHGEKPALVRARDVFNNGLRNMHNRFGGPLVNLNQPTYITINPLKPGTETRSKANVAAIKDIYIDIDLHDSTKPEFINDVYDYLLQHSFAQKVVPSMIIKSGRGLAVHFRYKEPLLTDNTEAVSLHEQMVSDIFKWFETEAARIKNDIGIDIDIDKHVKDITRITRLPGSVNPKAPKDQMGNITRCRIVYCTDAVYTPDTLAEAFEIDNKLRASSDVCKTKKKKPVSSQNAEVNHIVPKLSENKKLNKEKVDDVRTDMCFGCFSDTDVAFRSDDPERQHHILYNIDFLKLLFWYRNRNTGWFEGSKRNNFLYILAAHIASEDSIGKAIEVCEYYNQMMGEPFQEREVNYICSRVYLAENNVCYSTERMIADLNITDSELYYIYSKIDCYKSPDRHEKMSKGDYGYEYVGKKRSIYHRKNNKDANIERDKIVAYLWLIKEYTASAISRELKKYNEKHDTALSCSRSTINNVINRLGIRDRSISYEEIDFDNLTTYDSYNMAKRYHMPEYLYFRSKNTNKNTKRMYRKEYLQRKDLQEPARDAKINWNKIKKVVSRKQRISNNRTNKPVVTAIRRFIKALLPDESFDFEIQIEKIFEGYITNYYTDTGPPESFVAINTSQKENL